MFKRNRPPHHRDIDWARHAADLAEPMQLRALEPRVLLDAAAAATAATLVPEHQAQAAHDAHAEMAALVQAVAQTQDPVAPAAAPAAQRDTTAPAPPAATATAEPHGAVAEAAAPRFDGSLAPAQGTSVYFIDLAIPDPQQLATSLPAGAEVHYIDTRSDGVAQIAQTLAGRSNIDAIHIHILSHAEQGSLRLGDATLDAASMQGAYHDELQGIGRALSTNGDILLYGCDFAPISQGEQTVQLLAEITAADVAGSPTTPPAPNASAATGRWSTPEGRSKTLPSPRPSWDHVMVPGPSTGANLVSGLDRRRRRHWHVRNDAGHSRTINVALNSFNGVLNGGTTFTEAWHQRRNRRRRWRNQCRRHQQCHRHRYRWRPRRGYRSRHVHPCVGAAVTVTDPILTFNFLDPNLTLSFNSAASITV